MISFQELGKVDHTVIEYVPFRKDFYVEVPEIANMTKEEVDAYRWVWQWRGIKLNLKIIKYCDTNKLVE